MIQPGSWRLRRFDPVEVQVLSRLPMLARMYGLHPWDIDRLTWDQWVLYRDYLDADGGD